MSALRLLSCNEKAGASDTELAPTRRRERDSPRGRRPACAPRWRWLLPALPRAGKCRTAAFSFPPFESLPSKCKAEGPCKAWAFRFGGEGGIRTLAPVTPAYSLSRGAPYSHLGTSPQDAIVGERCWRREWDSNPRCFSASPVFKTGSLNRSDISPYVHLGQYSKIPTACQPTGANRRGRGAVPFTHCSGASRPPPGASSGAPLWNRRGKNERSA